MRTGFIVLFCGLLTLSAGIFLGGHPELLPGFARDALVDDDRALRAEIVETIENNFYKPVDEEKIDDASLKGIVESLEDPYSAYISPKEASAFQEAVTGEFEGVGMTVEKDERGLRVLEAFKGAPAAGAGIQKGDVILPSGRSIAGLSSTLATARIKGPAGSEVKLSVFSPGAEDPRPVEVKREKIEIPTVRGRLVERDGRKLAVVQLRGFSSGAHGVLKDEIDKLLKQGAEGIVLDLRGNGGGLLSEAVLVSSIFIEDGEIVSVRGRSRPERSEDADGDAIDEDVRWLCGGRRQRQSSEIVTVPCATRPGTVGEPHLRKGLVQEVEPPANAGSST